MTWLSAIYYSDFTERYKFDNQDECINYIKEKFKDKKLLKKELYIKALCGEENSDTSFVFICDGTDQSNENPKITMTLCFDKKGPGRPDYWPIDLSFEEEREKLIIAQRHILKLEEEEKEEEFL